MAQQSTSLNDAFTEHGIDVVKYSNNQAATIKPFMKYIESYLKQRIYEEGDRIATKTKLNELLKDVQAYLSGQYSEWFDEYFLPMLDEFSAEEAVFTDAVFSNVTPGYSSTNVTGEQVLAAAYRNPLIVGGSEVDFGSYTKNFTKNETQRAARAISAGFYSGQTTQEIVWSLVGKSSDMTTQGTKKGSVINMSRANAYSMVKTSTNHLSSQAKKIYAKKNNDIIIGILGISTLDTKTSARCRDYDGEVYLFEIYGDNYPIPAFHLSCRSTYSYVMSDKYEVLKGNNRTRPAVSEDSDGKAYAESVPQTQTYYTWLKNQPAAVQDKALGVERGRVFRNAGLSPEEFKAATTNQFGQELTIEEMRHNNKQIDEYMKKGEA